MLGRERYERAASCQDACAGMRNGYCPTTIKTTAGPVTLQRPKVRGTTERVADRLFGKGVTKTNALESLVIAGFVRGLSVRDVEAALAEALGPQATVSKSTVSRICAQIKTQFEAFRACLPNRKALTGDDCPVTRMGVISDEFWAAVESVMPSDEGKRGNRFGDHRLILEGIAWRFRTGSPWRDLPADFGPWQTVWKRHHRWSLDGTYEAMLAQVAAVFGVDPGMAEDLEKLLSVDSTNVRAHQHCAGARSDTLATGGSVELQESCR